jgi:hypothetical protein
VIEGGGEEGGEGGGEGGEVTGGFDKYNWNLSLYLDLIFEVIHSIKIHQPWPLTPDPVLSPFSKITTEIGNI